MPEIQTKDKLITLEELGVALNGKAGVTGVKGNAENSYRQSNVNLTPANIGAVAKTGDTMTGTLTIDDANTTPNQYAEIARFKREAMRNNDNVMLYLGKEFTEKNCGTILYHHAGDGSNSNYLALSAYNVPQSLRSYFDGHIELTQPLGVPYGGTGMTQGTIDITDFCTFPTGNVNTSSPYGGRLYYNSYLNCVFGTITMNDGASVANQTDIVYLRKDSSGTSLVANRAATCGTCVHSAVSPVAVPRINGSTIISSHTFANNITSPRYTIMAFLG